MTILRRLWFFMVDLAHANEPRRPEIVAALDKLGPVVESEIGKAMKPVRPVRHQLKLVRAEWWLRTYAPDHRKDVA